MEIDLLLVFFIVMVVVAVALPIGGIISVLLTNGMSVSEKNNLDSGHGWHGLGWCNYLDYLSSIAFSRRKTLEM